MRSTTTLITAVATLATLAGAASGQSLARPATAIAAGAKTIAVPAGDGTPVITDGIFSPGEWDDATRIDVSEGVTLYLKEFRGVVFVGVRGQSSNGIGPSELSLAAPGGPIQKLHASFALFEVELPAEGAAPAGRLGLTNGWYANELRRDEAEFERLRKEGTKNPMEVMQATSYPSDGIEFAIRRSKVRGPVWLMRLWASVVVGGRPGMVAYPASAPERTTDGWLELRLQ